MVADDVPPRSRATATRDRAPDFRAGCASEPVPVRPRPTPPPGFRG